MRTYTYQYQDESSLEVFIEENGIYSCFHVLVQVSLVGEKNGDIIESVSEQLKGLIPHARIFRSAGEDNGRNEPGISLSFTVFEEMTVDELTMEMAQLNQHLRKSELRIAQNATEQRQDQEKIIRLAYHDVLTELPNRLLFQQTLESVIGKSTSGDNETAVMFIDFDRFKMINDSVGHRGGDEILKKAVAKLQDTIGPNHFLSRFSGDEFLLLVPGMEGPGEIRKMARGILEAFKNPVVHDNREFFLSASIGVSMFPTDADNSEELMKNADTALNHAKRRGAGKIQFYKKEMKNYFADRLELERDLRKALDNGEFSVYHQPQISIGDGKVYGSEALIRWHHPKFGLVSPGTFIPLAEETGLINKIGRWVMETACKQAKGWQEAGYQDFSVSVNVSAQQFQQIGFLNDVRDVLNQTGLAPEHLHLELTESITLRDIRHSIHHVKALKKLGVKVSIDDFGTGYSSLSYLKDFA
ncbi:MAG TPA: EAL domain-containing protein, partial [Bacillales bacterium]